MLKSRLAEPGAFAVRNQPGGPLHCYWLLLLVPSATRGTLKAKKVQLFNMAAGDMPADMTKSLPCILSLGPRFPKHFF